MNTQQAWVGKQNWSSIAPPNVNPVTVHNCGTTMEKLKPSNHGQVWAQPAVERYRWGSRVIESPAEYYKNIRNWVIQKRTQEIHRMREEDPTITQGKWLETEENLGDNKRLASLVSEGQQKLMNYLNNKFAESCKEIPMFFKNNPLPEALTITDMQVVTYQSNNNPLKLYHKALVTVWNTKRYVSLSFKIGAYQDLKKGNTWVVVWDYVNPNNCPLGESIKGNPCGEPASYDLNSGRLETQPQRKKLKWINEPALADNSYSKGGTYSPDGPVVIVDEGPEDLDNLIKEMGDVLTRNNFYTTALNYNGGSVW